jgi:hypothetical protein
VAEEEIRGGGAAFREEGDMGLAGGGIIRLGRGEESTLSPEDKNAWPPDTTL